MSQQLDDQGWSITHDDGPNYHPVHGPAATDEEDDDAPVLGPPAYAEPDPEPMTSGGTTGEVRDDNGPGRMIAGGGFLAILGGGVVAALTLPAWALAALAAGGGVAGVAGWSAWRRHRKGTVGRVSRVRPVGRTRTPKVSTPKTASSSRPKSGTGGRAKTGTGRAGGPAGRKATGRTTTGAKSTGLGPRRNGRASGVKPSTGRSTTGARRVGGAEAKRAAAARKTAAGNARRTGTGPKGTGGRGTGPKGRTKPITSTGPKGRGGRGGGPTSTTGGPKPKGRGGIGPKPRAIRPTSTTTGGPKPKGRLRPRGGGGPTITTGPPAGGGGGGGKHKRPARFTGKGPLHHAVKDDVLPRTRVGGRRWARLLSEQGRAHAWQELGTVNGMSLRRRRMLARALAAAERHHRDGSRVLRFDRWMQRQGKRVQDRWTGPWVDAANRRARRRFNRVRDAYLLENWRRVQLFVLLAAGRQGYRLRDWWYKTQLAIFVATGVLLKDPHAILRLMRQARQARQQEQRVQQYVNQPVTVEVGEPIRTPDEAARRTRPALDPAPVTVTCGPDGKPVIDGELVDPVPVTVAGGLDEYDTDLDTDADLGVEAARPISPAPPVRAHGPNATAQQKGSPTMATRADWSVHHAQEPLIVAHDQLFSALPNSVPMMVDYLGKNLAGMYAAWSTDMQGMGSRLVSEYPIETEVHDYFTAATNAFSACSDGATRANDGYQLANPNDVQRNFQPRTYEAWNNVPEGPVQGVDMASLVQRCEEAHSQVFSYRPVDPPDLRAFIRGLYLAYLQLSAHVERQIDEQEFPGAGAEIATYWGALAQTYNGLAEAAGVIGDGYEASAQHELARFDEQDATTHLTNVNRY